MLSCKCLNVIIESETNDFQPVTAELLNLTEEEKKDVFFEQELRQVDKLSRINKEHSGLVISRNVGNWIVHQCLNCDVHTHAIHRDRGAACVLVSSKLLTTPTISSLRSSDDYSEVFNIVVHPGKEEYQDKLPSEDILYDPVQLALAGIKQRLSEAMNKELAATDERLVIYNQQQLKALDKFRSRANREHRILSRIILDKRCKPTQVVVSSSLSLSNESNMQSTLPSPKLSMDSSPLSTFTTSSPSDKPKITLVTKTTNNKQNRAATLRQMSTPLPVNTSLDSEGLFQLEEMEDIPQMSASDHEESDNEEKEESAHLSRNRSQSVSIAKSLPVNIPAFMSPLRTRNVDEEHDLLPHNDVQHPSDIAASIKALAKSVHGDTVFGDLPRPRFSTQI